MSTETTCYNVQTRKCRLEAELPKCNSESLSISLAVELKMETAGYSETLIRPATYDTALFHKPEIPNSKLPP